MCLLVGTGLEDGLVFPVFFRIDAGFERLDERLRGGVAGKLAVVGVISDAMDDTELARLEDMYERSDDRDGLRRWSVGGVGNWSKENSVGKIGSTGSSSSCLLASGTRAARQKNKEKSVS